eukprot:jgi/Chlat1/8841/Chrsp91S08178
MTNARASSDLRQMAMRGAGETVCMRQRYGHKGIEVLCTKEDYALVKELYNFTAEVLKSAGTGNPHDLDKWLHAMYLARFQPVLFSSRRLAQKCMDFSSANSEISSNVEDVAPLSVPSSVYTQRLHVLGSV